MACWPIARGRPSSPAPASSWRSWPRLLSCLPCQCQPRTRLPHPPLPLPAPTVLARTGAGLPASCRSEGFPHEGFPVPARSTALAVFTTRDLPHGADGPRVSIAWLSSRLARCESQPQPPCPSLSVRPSASPPPPSCSHRQCHHWQGAPDSIESP